MESRCLCGGKEKKIDPEPSAHQYKKKKKKGNVRGIIINALCFAQRKRRKKKKGRKIQDKENADPIPLSIRGITFLEAPRSCEGDQHQRNDKGGRWVELPRLSRPKRQTPIDRDSLVAGRSPRCRRRSVEKP